MFFRQLKLGPMDNFCYLLGCEKTKECAVIDCGFEHEKLVAAAEEEGYRITKILLTHFHYDHSREAEILSKKTGAEVFGHERGRLKETGESWVIPKDFTSLADDAEVSIGTISGKALYTPGHQSDHLAYVFEPYFLTGDVLFIGGVGRVDLPDSDPEQMKASLELIKTLPDEWVVYPGHDYGEVAFRTLGEEKRLNPFLTGERIL